MRAGVTLWDLHHDRGTLCASTLKSNYKRLIPQAKKAGVTLNITEKKGIPAVFERHKGRFGFLAGAAVFIFLIVYFSGYVWTIQISGNKMVSSREIQYTLSDLGFCAGVRRDSFDLKNLEQEAMMKLPGLSYMHINLDGSVAKIIVGERSQRPEVIPDERPCNIKAATTGQIVRIKVYQGKTTLKANDAVQKDELLVSGVVEEPKSGVTRYVHARAEVIARTKHELSVTVPYKTTELQDTGKTVKKYALNLLNLQIPFYHGEPQGNYRRMVYKSPLVICGATMPVCGITTVFYEYHETPVTLSKQQAELLAKTLLTQKENTELSCAAVKGKTYTQKADGNSFTLTGSYDCEEDIAVSQEVKIGGS